MDDRPQAIQSKQYEFPYHHIPHFNARGNGNRVRLLKWGLEYLIYMEHVAKLVCDAKPSSVLDVGCGDGFLLGHLPTSIPKRVGVDLDERALSFAHAFFPEVDFRARNVAEIEEQFDVVCAVEVLEHIPDEHVGAFLTAVAARVRPGGLLVLTVPTINEPLNPKHFRHYDHALLEQQAATGMPQMTLESARYFYRLTLFEKIYRNLTQNALIYGDVPLLRRFVFNHAKRNADKATPFDGMHLVSLFRRPA